MTERMVGNSCIDENVCIERVHLGYESARCSGRMDHIDQKVSAFDGQRWGVVERASSGAPQQIAHSLGIGQRLIGTSHSHRVGSDDDCDRFAMAGDCHFLAGEHPVENCGQ
jgi:hypothetical protein